MNIHSPLPTTADDFLRWNEGREGKREFVRGRVVEMMINVTEDHYRIASRCVIQLASQFDLNRFIVGSADFGVRIGEVVRYPDVMVHIPVGGKKLATPSPVLIAEVLSVSSLADDFGPKKDDYLSLESLRHYLVLSQDEPRVWLWSRGKEGGWTGPDMVTETAMPLELPGLGVTLDLAALYRGIAGTSG